MKTYQCLIVEDEPLAQRVIQRHINQCNQLQLAGICENALQAYHTINTKIIDLIFLDITLPALNGIEFVRSLKNPPAVIFTTAYSEYAVTSYELEAVDYLLKPVTLQRFEGAINKFLRLKQGDAEGEDFIFIKESGRFVKLYFKEILFIEARKDYLMISLQTKAIIVYGTMKSMEELLPAATFIRIHRSYIIHRDAVLSISSTNVQLSNSKTLPIGEKYKQAIIKEFKSGF